MRAVKLVCRANLQCQLFGEVGAAILLLREKPGGAYVPAAVWPSPKRDLSSLFRQTAAGRWDDVIDAVRKSLTG
jgi:hypothetical protein